MKTPLNIEPLIRKFKTTLLLSGISIGGSVILVAFIVLTQIPVLVGVNHSVSQNNAETAQLQAKAKILQGVREDELRKDLNTTLVAVPEDRNIPATVDHLQLLLIKDQLQLNSISFTGGDPTLDQAAGAQSFKVRIEVIGTPTALKNFITDLKTAPQIFKLTGLDIIASKGGEIQDDIELTTYYNPPPQALESLDAEVTPLSASDKQLLSTLEKNMQSLPVAASSSYAGGRGKSNPFQ